MDLGRKDGRSGYTHAKKKDFSGVLSAKQGGDGVTGVMRPLETTRTAALSRFYRPFGAQILLSPPAPFGFSALP